MVSSLSSIDLVTCHPLPTFILFPSTLHIYKEIFPLLKWDENHLHILITIQGKEIHEGIGMPPMFIVLAEG